MSTGPECKTSISSGHFVAIVGPDGVGKTTLARSLLSSWLGPRGYVHFRPPVLAGLTPLPDTSGTAPPKFRGRGSRVGGWLRLAYNLTLFWLGYIVRIRPVVNRGGLVVADRWAFGYLVHPVALRFFGPAWLAKVVLRLFPRPSLVVVAYAPVETISSRKGELSDAEIALELVKWDQLPFRPIIKVDTTSSPSEVVSIVMSTLLDADD